MPPNIGEYNLLTLRDLSIYLTFRDATVLAIIAGTIDTPCPMLLAPLNQCCD